ncbi:FAD:protein FMN transferase [Bordetella flabilis]|uniref:FAD:protein FMN transferase n=1 Tax=Bordetella flabilis TaxID=463014 RepID=A0A193GLA9_9BORD|nr:FAD:protein FMN transferase [Bordetella flabilis]ANN80353.1 thiamine biosynthesis protein ApbE [Bordetella flabilis]
MAVRAPTPAPARPAAPAGATMGTTWSARLLLPPGVTQHGARHAIQAALDDVVAQMSHWENDTDLSRFNRALQGWYRVPAAFFEVMRYALWLAEETQGAYDPAAGALAEAWGFGPRGAHQDTRQASRPPGARPPDPAWLGQWRSDAGWRALRLDESAQRIWQPGGVMLDLSSIAKGYGVDAAAKALDALGLRHYLVEVGGELRARGKRPDGQPWRVGIESPEDGRPALALSLGDAALATSGDYQRYFMHQGRRHAHTLDPRTGLAVDNGVASVSVLHGGCMQADALATALLVLGERNGMAWARARGIAAVFLLRGDGGLRVAPTPAFQACLAQPSGRRLAAAYKAACVRT